MASELYETLVKDPVLREVFRELGRRGTFGRVGGGGKAGNLDARFLIVTFKTADLEHRIDHGLGRTPVGIIQAADPTSLGGITGLRIEVTKAADDRYLYLKCDEARTVHLLIW